MKLITIIGMFAGALTTVSFFPQVVKIWKCKSTKDISLIMFILFTAGVVLWLVYGIYLMQWPVILSNLVTLILSIIILSFKFKYK